MPQVRFKNQNRKHRTWRPNHQQAFSGSLCKGEGFSFWRKLKIQQNYNKLLWKVKKTPTSQDSQFTDHYPEHLKHLYLAEEERLRKQQRKVGLPGSEEQADQPLPEEGYNSERTWKNKQSSDYQHSPEPPCTLHSVTIPQIQAKRAAEKFESEMRKKGEGSQRLYKTKN